MAAHHQLAFPVAQTAAAAQQARHRVVASVRAWDIQLGEDELDGIELVAAELVTNAVLHATSGPVMVGVHRTGAALVVEVHDTSQAFPETGPVDVNAESGRGLHLVSVLADRHGTDLTPTGKRCWAEFDVAQRGCGSDGGPGQRPRATTGLLLTEETGRQGGAESRPPSVQQSSSHTQATEGRPTVAEWRAWRRQGRQRASSSTEWGRFDRQLGA
ncbi:ATP-binding protein [Streptomyces sp. ISL-100]|uniref:ATP-binding protein n=1 Tax=Streptomyces sp. ISL-100 TaxID=2819173 RepID=UPI001BE84C5E|nr:ATP-binding protein [Streptomyces sp. ISL-100]MBT2397398.1 ATP-binding protein [Streptomyces sp. ISL-100]